MVHMTQAPQGDIPAFTLGDRLAKALRHAEVSNGEMAEYLDIHRNTVSAYLNDRLPVKGGTLRLWAMRTGVRLEWLETGTGSPAGPPSPPEGPKGERGKDELAQLTAQKASRRRTTSGGANNRRYVAAA